MRRVVPSFSFVATANCAHYVGASPVFADVEPEDGNVSVRTVEPVLTDRTKALVVVHQGGLPADVEPLRRLCDSRGIALVEDAACAGRYVYQITKRLQQTELNDAALAASLIDRKYGDNLMRLFSTAAHGRALAAAGFEGDLAACAAVDSYPVIPIFQDRQITKLGPERER